jgi:hypothetical protein
VLPQKKKSLMVSHILEKKTPIGWI